MYLVIQAVKFNQASECVKPQAVLEIYSFEHHIYLPSALQTGARQGIHHESRTKSRALADPLCLVSTTKFALRKKTTRGPIVHCPVVALDTSP